MKRAFDSNVKVGQEINSCFVEIFKEILNSHKPKGFFGSYIYRSCHFNTCTESTNWFSGCELLLVHFDY
jgi:hypothetical protein